MHEAQFHQLRVFVTLTYDDEHLPTGGTLVKRHFQLFMKRLRKVSQGKIRFFGCGEYGDETLRPHYHAILFGVDFSDKKRYAENGNGEVVYTSALLDSIWGFGACKIGGVSFDSAAYVARYCVKKITGDLAEAHYQGRLPEFALMSRRPGIGADWFDKYQGDVFPSDRVVVKGREMLPPRYYTDKLKKLDEAMHLGVKARRVQKAKLHKADQTPARLAVRAEVAKAKLNLKRRTI